MGLDNEAFYTFLFVMTYTTPTESFQPMKFCDAKH